MMKAFAQVIVTTLLLTSLALAHGGAKHVMGTVTAIGQTSITIKTTSDQGVEIRTSAKTTYQKSGKTAAARDLKVGDRVVVEAHEKDGKLEAEGVRFGASTHTNSNTTHAHSANKNE